VCTSRHVAGLARASRLWGVSCDDRRSLSAVIFPLNASTTGHRGPPPAATPEARYANFSCCAGPTIAPSNRPILRRHRRQVQVRGLNRKRRLGACRSVDRRFVAPRCPVENRPGPTRNFRGILRTDGVAARRSPASSGAPPWLSLLPRVACPDTTIAPGSCTTGESSRPRRRSSSCQGYSCLSRVRQGFLTIRKLLSTIR
jgi:hypothetical protein